MLMKSRKPKGSQLRVPSPPHGRTFDDFREAGGTTRREFLRMGGAAGLGVAGAHLLLGLPAVAASSKGSGSLSFGIVTDSHYADKDTAMNRYYRESIQKMEQCVTAFNKAGLSFVVEMGDFIDKAKDKKTELGYLESVRNAFEALKGRRHYVLGNHDLATFSKEEFLGHCGSPGKEPHYAFDKGHYRFVVLDACFKRDGSAYEAGNFRWTDTSIPKSQQEWLSATLERARKKKRKAIAFVHQNLHDEKDSHGVKNAPEVRKVLEGAGNVLAVFQGHNHAGAHKKINGIHYFTLRAMVEGSIGEDRRNSSYAVVSIDRNHRITIRGFGKQFANGRPVVLEHGVGG